LRKYRREEVRGKAQKKQGISSFASIRKEMLVLLYNMKKLWPAQGR